MGRTKDKYNQGGKISQCTCDEGTDKNLPQLQISVGNTFLSLAIKQQMSVIVCCVYREKKERDNEEIVIKQKTVKISPYICFMLNTYGWNATIWG